MVVDARMKLAFYKGSKDSNPLARLFDRLVCWKTDGEFSHVELVVSGPLDNALCWSSSFRDGGVRRKTIDLTTGRWQVVDVPLCINTDKAVAWFIEHEGEPYDIAGLFGFILPWRTENKKKWFCSESICEAFGIARAWRYDTNSFYSYINLLSLLDIGLISTAQTVKS